MIRRFRAFYRWTVPGGIMAGAARKTWWACGLGEIAAERGMATWQMAPRPACDTLMLSLGEQNRRIVQGSSSIIAAVLLMAVLKYRRGRGHQRGSTAG